MGRRRPRKKGRQSAGLSCKQRNTGYTDQVKVYSQHLALDCAGQGCIPLLDDARLSRDVRLIYLHTFFQFIILLLYESTESMPGSAALLLKNKDYHFNLEIPTYSAPR